MLALRACNGMCVVAETGPHQYHGYTQQLGLGAPKQRFRCAPPVSSTSGAMEFRVLWIFINGHSVCCMPVQARGDTVHGRPDVMVDQPAVRDRRVGLGSSRTFEKCFSCKLSMPPRHCDPE